MFYLIARPTPERDPLWYASLADPQSTWHWCSPEKLVTAYDLDDREDSSFLASEFDQAVTGKDRSIKILQSFSAPGDQEARRSAFWVKFSMLQRSPGMTAADLTYRFGSAARWLSMYLSHEWERFVPALAWGVERAREAGLSQEQVKDRIDTAIWGLQPAQDDEPDTGHVWWCPTQTVIDIVESRWSLEEVREILDDEEAVMGPEVPWISYE